MGKQICRKKVKCKRRTIILPIWTDLLSQMTCAKIRPQGLYRSGKRNVFPYIGLAVILVNGPRLFFNNLSFPCPMEAPLEIWAILVQRLRRKSRLKFSTFSPYITRTCLYNVDPLEPHFYIVKLGFTGVYIIFLFLLKNIDCGYSLEPPRQAVLTSTHNICFEQKYEKYQNFYLKIFIFWW